MLTVGQLIELLEKVDKDSPVRIEGCDCQGDASGVEIRLGPKNQKVVLITRCE
jgi:hypothetical protein